TARAAAGPYAPWRCRAHGRRRSRRAPPARLRTGAGAAGVAVVPGLPAKIACIVRPAVPPIGRRHEAAESTSMALAVACQVAPIERIDIAGDSTFALLLEAQRRGHDLFYYTPHHLSLVGKRLLARGCSLAVEDRRGDHYRQLRPRVEDLVGFDVVLLRQDP